MPTGETLGVSTGRPRGQSPWRALFTDSESRAVWIANQIQIANQMETKGIEPSTPALQWRCSPN